jgi:2-isopropylmalate synthase
VNKATREIHELQSYTIRSISEGADAIGEVTTEVGDGLISASGKSAGPDILRASVEAYIDALNGLAAHRAETEAVKFASSGVMQAFGGESQRDA